MKKKEKIHHKPLTLRERIDIEQLYKYSTGINEIARQLNRNKSTISRELKGKPRNGIGKYQADIAHRQATERIENRGNVAILDKNQKLSKYVIEKLQLGWTPEIISGRLEEDFPEDESMSVCHEAIYQYIYSPSRIGSNGKMREDYIDLRDLLPRRHKRRAKKGFRKAQKAERRAKLPSIESRPEVVDLRTRIGDWEDDFLVSKASKVCIKSVNERKSGVVFFGRTTDGTAKAGDKVLVDKLRQIPDEYLKTLTSDNGSDNEDCQWVETELGVSVFFARPYHSWERGSNENSNGLLRRFFPKGTDWSIISDEDIFQAEYLINNRPRKRLGWKTPVEVFYQETGVALYC